MLNISDIISSSIDENLALFLDEIANHPSNNTEESLIHIYEALINYSSLLIKNYHDALKTELLKQGIEI